METPQRVHGDEDGGGTPTLPRDHSSLLREQEAERERLRMDNFNQALRINFLEERLLRMKQGTDFASEDLESELAQLRLTLEERDHELRQRNFSMIRATEAIDMLTAQLQEAQVAAARAKEEAERDAQAQLHEHLEARGGVDAETAEKWRVELETAIDREQQSYVKIQELEHELQRQENARTTVMTQLHEVQDERTRERTEMELQRQREQQTLQQLERTNVKVLAEVEHWKMMSKQREEQVTALQVQLETTRQEKQALDVRYQAKLKQMEEQVQHQMQQLQRESENYRTEHTRLLTDRETALYEKERLTMEKESSRQERLRLQAEMERLSKERQQVAEEMERVRLQCVTLRATSEEQSKAMESLRVERQDAVETIQRLEAEVQQRRKQQSEHEVTVTRLESRLKHCEGELEAQRLEKKRIQEEGARLQLEIERLRKERLELIDEREQGRGEKEKLATRCEELSKIVEELTRDRDGAVETLDRLKAEIQHYQKLEKEHKVTIRTLEGHLDRAETEMRWMKEQYSNVEASEPSNERLLTLENDCHSMEEDNRRLRAELMEFQKDLETMEQQVEQSHDALRSEAAKTQEQSRLLSGCQEHLQQYSIQLKQCQKQLAECEAELTGRTKRVEQLERQLAERVETVSSITARDEHQQERYSHIVTDKRALLQELDKERRRTSQVKHVAAALKREHLAAQRELEAVKRELYLLLPTRRDDKSSHSIARLVHEAIAALKNDVKTATTAIEQRWTHQAATMNSELDRLTTHLQSSQQQLEALKRTCVNVHDANENWRVRYEALCLEKEAERQSLEEEIRRIEMKGETREREAEGRRRSVDETTCDCQALKESNRLLFDEVQERRKSAKYARQQYMGAIRENKELLKAIAKYKEALTSRDKDMDKYKAAVRKYTQQLARRVDVGEAKQTLLEQLEQTQFLILETYKRWENCPIGRGLETCACGNKAHDEALIVQLDEYIGRIHLSGERWSDLMTQAQELQRRYGETWQAASRDDRTEKQPLWVQNVERTCSRLLTESVRIAKVVRDDVHHIATLLERERDEKERMDNNGKHRDDPAARHRDRFRGPSSSLPSDQPQYQSPSKQKRLTRPYRSSLKTSTPKVATLDTNALSALGRVGMKVQDLEKEIRTYDK